MKKIKAPQIIILIYLITMLFMAINLNISLISIFNDSLIKFAMNFILVLSLVPMLKCGIGMNFGLAIGICAGLVGMCISVQFKIPGMTGFLFAIFMTIIFGIIFGYLYSKILNKLKGKEEIIGMFCGYSFVFIMNIFWSLAPFTNRQMLYPIGGQGLRPKISLENTFAGVLDNLLNIQIGEVVIPVGILLFIILMCVIVNKYFNTRSGLTMKVISENEHFAYLSGVNINKYRTKAIIFSTILAGIGIVVYTQSYGFVQLYDSPLGFSFPAVSAILIGGASRKESSVLNAVIGTYLFQTTYLLSVPVANAMLLPELAETLRMIITNFIILYAFVYEGREMGLWKKQKNL